MPLIHSIGYATDLLINAAAFRCAAIVAAYVYVVYGTLVVSYTMMTMAAGVGSSSSSSSSIDNASV